MTDVDIREALRESLACDDGYVTIARTTASRIAKVQLVTIASPLPGDEGLALAIATGDRRVALVQDWLAQPSDCAQPELCLDARIVGNVARFIRVADRRRGEKPNLIKQAVLTNHQNLSVPRLAFFAAEIRQAAPAPSTGSSTPAQSPVDAVVYISLGQISFNNIAVISCPL